MGVGRSKAGRTSNRSQSAALSLRAPNSQIIPGIKEEHVALLKTHGIDVTPIEPLGARVRGFDLRAAGRSEPAPGILITLQLIMAERGYLVFAGQGVLSGDEQVRASCLWGGRRMHSTHGVHPKAPNRDIFRLSNDERVGIRGVGPQWHNDGSFEVGVFSHVGYHIVKVPEKGGDTQFAHQGAAFDMLPPEKQKLWEGLVSVNATSGVLHPMVHAHPISGRRSVYLHLGMTGGIMEKVEDGFRLMEESELLTIFNDYNDLMNAGLPDKNGNWAISYPYEEGDCIFIDNLAICHRAASEAHAPKEKQGLRILHRTTIMAMKDFSPGFGLPDTVTSTILRNANANGRGVFESGGLGFRWDENIKMQN